MTISSQPEPTNEQRRIIYQARRSLKELNFSINPYVKELSLTAGVGFTRTFAQMLTHEDPDLLDYFTNQNRPEEDAIWALVNKIKRWHHTEEFCSSMSFIVMVNFVLLYASSDPQVLGLACWQTFYQPFIMTSTTSLRIDTAIQPAGYLRFLYILVGRLMVVLAWLAPLVLAVRIFLYCVTAVTVYLTFSRRTITF